MAVLAMEGTVEISPAGSGRWFPAKTNQVLLAGDQVRTGERSRAALRLTDATAYQMRERSVVQVPAPAKRTILEVLRGSIYLFHRDKPGLFPIGTPTASAIIRGTEFHLEVAEDDATTITMLDGVVEMTNEFGGRTISGGEAAIARPGQAPARTAALEAINVIQWCLYYPGVLDVDELELTEPSRTALAESLAAYRVGDLLQALEKYPAAREPAADEERVYRAAVLLAVGSVEEAQKSLNELKGLNELNGRLAGALRKLIAAVKRQSAPSTLNPQPSTALATEWLAESYYQQSRRNLEEALKAARKAVEKSPNFSFGWARVGELEFSFGRASKAMEAVERSLQLAPRNAEALALKGFLLAARNDISGALSFFDQAIAVDGALGNAWLGRGLCLIRRGQTQAGIQDLQTAALREPQRALLRSYLGKAFAISDFRFPISDSARADTALALKELELAKRFDTNDPTAWLYSALVKEQDNRIIEAVQDLERSRDLSDHRNLYRSRLLLDQDQAVRGVNLARVYQDAGLSDVSVWEASRAVNADYANFSAHLFLADSFQQLRDLRSVNQRFETAAVNEYLLATLLAPVGAGTMAHSVSQQEYSKLFQTDGFGLASSTEYLSRGAWTQSAAQYGTFGNFGYALSGFYQSDPGQYRNNDLEQTELSLQLQQQITPKDTAYFRAIYGKAEGGDLAQHYDPTAAFAAGGPNTELHFEETQEPILLAGYRHEWAPGNQTLFLAGRLQDTFRATNGQQNTLVLERDVSGNIIRVDPITIEQKYRNELEVYTAELQQIWQASSHTLIAGARYQAGDFDTMNRHTNASFIFPFLFPQDVEDVSADFERASVYAYDYWQVFEPLLLTAGLSYDWLKYPANFRYAPLSGAEDTTDLLAPKAGFIWTPTKKSTVRFGYSQALGGVTFDQSFRLEPVQVAGFNQAFRSIIPESAAGASAAERFETWGLSLEQRIGRGTFLGLSGEILQSEASRLLGTYDFDPLSAVPVTRSEIREDLEFQERSLAFSAAQLIGREWSLRARYRLSQAELREEFPGVDSSATLTGGFQRQQDLEALLHRVDLVALYNRSCGFFAEGQAIWYGQRSDGYASGLPSDYFWQFNLFAGYRFAQRRAELRLGLLNLTDQDYRLNPLNLTADLPRERTFSASFRFNF